MKYNIIPTIVLIVVLAVYGVAVLTIVPSVEMTRLGTDTDEHGILASLKTSRKTP